MTLVGRMLSHNRHVAVMDALMTRNLMARFGRENFGFFWFILEPTMLTVGVMLIWSVIHQSYIHSVPVITFVLTGYMPLTLWRHLTNPMVCLFRNNASLLYHRPVSCGYILLSRMLVEFLSVSGAVAGIYFVVASLNIIDPMADPGLVLVGWLFTGWFYGAIGMIIAAITEYWEVSERFIQPIQYFALPVSGVFFMVDWIPGWGQKLIVLNPAVHCTEILRAGFLGNAIATYYDLWYLACWSMLLTIVGSALVYRVRDHIRIG